MEEQIRANAEMVVQQSRPAKVAKQMDNGLEDGILSFFTVIPIIFKEP